MIMSTDSVLYVCIISVDPVDPFCVSVSLCLCVCVFFGLVFVDIFPSLIIITTNNTV